MRSLRQWSPFVVPAHLEELGERLKISNVVLKHQNGFLTRRQMLVVLDSSEDFIDSALKVAEKESPVARMELGSFVATRRSTSDPRACLIGH